MKILIVYESFFGNTEKIAAETRDALTSKHTVLFRKVSEAATADIESSDLIITGAPTRAFRPSPGMQKFLKSLSQEAMKNKQCAVFDTRVDVQDIHSKFLTFMVKLFGYAAEPMAKILRKKGAADDIQINWFFVKDSEGPLTEGELERARSWAGSLAK